MDNTNKRVKVPEEKDRERMLDCLSLAFKRAVAAACARRQFHLEYEEGDGRDVSRDLFGDLGARTSQDADASEYCAAADHQLGDLGHKGVDLGAVTCRSGR